MSNTLVRNTERVSNAQRQANARAVERRTKWRRDYAITVYAIRGAKHNLKVAHRSNRHEYAAVYRVQWRAMQQAVAVMMKERAEIAAALRETAYAYVDETIAV